MEKTITENEKEYFKKYVNYGNEGFESIQKIKCTTVGIFLIFPTAGLLLSFTWVESVVLRIFLLVIMVCGIVCTIASEIWFSGNRGYLFLTWLELTGIGVTFFSIGITMIYGISNIIIFIFVIEHVIIAILILNSIVKHISARRIYKNDSKRVRYYGLGGCLGFLGGVLLTKATEGFDFDVKKIVLATCCMVISTLMLIGIRRLFQLYYAAKYNIYVLNTWDAQSVNNKWKEEYQCPLLAKPFEESLCIKINYENEQLMKPDKLETVKKELNMTSDEIKQLCKSCERYPFIEKEN